MSASVASYYASKETIDGLQLPWGVRNMIRSHITRPIHPCAKKMKKFIRAWRKDVADWSDGDKEMTLFGSGNLQNVPFRRKRGVYFTDLLNYTTRNIPMEMVGDVDYSSPTEAVKRAIVDMYNISGKYDEHAFELPSMRLVERTFNVVI